MAIQPHSRIESQLTDPTYKGPYLSRIELILKDMLENYGRIAFVGPYDTLEDLPETGQAGYVYLVRVEGSNLCDEYIWDEQEEEYNYVGRFEIDLDDYQTKDLSNPITIDSVVYTTVESALAAMNVSLSNVSRDALKKVSIMPQNPSNNDLVVWQGNNAYKVGHTYKYVEGTGETLYAWQVDNPGGVGDGTVIYTKLAIPDEDTNIYKSDGTAYSSSTDDPTYELMVGGESAITIEIFSLSQMQSWERGALRKASEDIVATSGEWVEVTKDNIQDDWEQSDSSAPDYIKNKPTLGTAASRNATNQISAGSTALPEAGAVKTALDSKEESGVAETLVKDTVGWTGKNRFDKNNLISGGYDRVSHSFVTNTVLGTCYIKVEEGETFTISGMKNWGEGSINCFVDSNLEYISTVGSRTTAGGYASNVSVTVPSNAEYLAIVCYHAQSSEEIIPYDDTNTIQVELGTEVTSYEPYHATVDATKADKVTNATSGHLAGLDSNGNLTDSGVSPTEEVTLEGNPITFDSPFEQDAKSVVVSVKPIQDLHGYDHPWPAGGGKNLLPTPNSVSIVQGSGLTVENANGVITISGNAVGGDSVQVNFDTVNFISDGQFALGNSIAINTANISLYTSGSQLDYFAIASANRVINISSYSTIAGKNINSYRINFTQNVTLNNFIIAPMLVNAGADISTFAPYSNICPISGIDEVEIPVTGKNLFDISTLVLKPWNGNDTNNARARAEHARRLPIGTTFTCSFSDDFTNIYDYSITQLNSDYPASTILNETGWKHDPSITITNNYSEYVGITIRRRDFGNITLDDLKNTQIQLEIGETATPYEPYNPNNHTTTIPLPSTLYDADVDVTEGDADSRFGMVDMGDLNWIKITTNVYAAEHRGMKVVSDNETADLKCEIFYPSNYMSLPEGSIAIRRGEEIWVRTFTDDLTEFENLVNGYKLVYPLATPTTLSFTPTDVELLEGTNVVSTNAEKVAVTYKAGILATLGDIDDLNDKVKTKFDKVNVATIENGSTASKTYYKGDYIVRYDGCLYDVTATILSGAAFTSSNTHKTTIGDELNKFKTYVSTSNSPINGNDVDGVSIPGYLPISPFQVFSWSGSGTVSITPKSSGGTWNISGDVSNVRYGQIFMRI